LWSLQQNNNEDIPTLVAIENEGYSKGEEIISHRGNKGINGSHEDGILLRVVEYSMDTKMDLDLCDGSSNTSNRE